MDFKISSLNIFKHVNIKDLLTFFAGDLEGFLWITQQCFATRVKLNHLELEFFIHALQVLAKAALSELFYDLSLDIQAYPAQLQMIDITDG